MWKSIGTRELELGIRFLDWMIERTSEQEPDSGWLPTPLEIAKNSPFADDGQGEEDIQTLLGIILWIKTARAAGYANDWIPTASDLTKSALFERIRSGAQPLPEPPPLGMSCPWYAVVEDPGPHYSFDATFGGSEGSWLSENHVAIYQNVYEIVKHVDEKCFVVRDGRHNTSYRFQLWFDPDWKHPSNHPQIPSGGWFLQNIVFKEPD